MDRKAAIFALVTAWGFGAATLPTTAQDSETPAEETIAGTED